MEEVRSSQSTETTHEDRPEVTSRIKNGFISFTASLQKCFRYFKAFFVGKTKKLTARTEREATEADLMESKMQVEATDAAEETKKRLDESN